MSQKIFDSYLVAIQTSKITLTHNKSSLFCHIHIRFEKRTNV